MTFQTPSYIQVDGTAVSYLELADSSFWKVISREPSHWVAQASCRKLSLPWQGAGMTRKVERAKLKD